MPTTPARGVLCTFAPHLLFAAGILETKMLGKVGSPTVRRKLTQAPGEYFVYQQGAMWVISTRSRTGYSVQRPDHRFGVLPSFHIVPIHIFLFLDRAAVAATVHGMPRCQ